MNRREFLKLAAVSSLLAGCRRWAPRGRIGLALGGGGARGLAHVPMLEAMDELGIRPYRIAGTSIGAVIGTMYAAGMKGREIRELIDRITVSADESWLAELFEQGVTHWWNLIELQLGHGGLINTDAFIGFLENTIGVSRFADLEIPLKVVATDFWDRKQVIFDSGRLNPAIQASIAIPGLFSPLRYRGRVLVDGGLVNPVPYDLLMEECEVVIAIDVSGHGNPKSDEGPGYFETLFNTMQIMQTSILREKIKRQPPHIFIHPELQGIHVLDFNRVDEIYQQAMSARNKLMQELR